MSQDLLNDALTSMRNAIYASKRSCELKASKLIGNVLKVMQENNYIEHFEYIDDRKGGKFKVTLSTSMNTCGIIKPRFAVKKTELEKFEARYLPGQDFGIIIVTTPQGVMDHSKAKKLGIGGKLLAYVY
ncbi:MAG: 30S ribosomal protein S8 [Candidatus Thermoplasmatota archaeon]|nr:30S ribosomal protein S8 [Candidatus Thermoplasmatota archaeon]MDI6856004.1 30S ribosomal protein S8 [Candidatus Thermoplasmatota archaeon]